MLINYDGLIKEVILQWVVLRPERPWQPLMLSKFGQNQCDDEAVNSLSPRWAGWVGPVTLQTRSVSWNALQHIWSRCFLSSVLLDEYWEKMQNSVHWFTLCRIICSRPSYVIPGCTRGTYSCEESYQEIKYSFYSQCQALNYSPSGRKIWRSDSKLELVTNKKRHCILLQNTQKVCFPAESDSPKPRKHQLVGCKWSFLGHTKLIKRYTETPQSSIAHMCFWK